MTVDWKTVSKAEMRQYKAEVEAKLKVLEERIAALEAKPKRGRPPRNPLVQDLRDAL